MMSHSNTGECLTAVTFDGILMIHGSPATLSWIPRDVVNDAFNFGGIVTVGTFDSIEDAQQAAQERYSVSAETWKADDLDLGRAEVHTPQIDGHKVVRHDTRWK